MISQHVFFKQAAFSSFLILHVEGIAELYTWGLSCFLFINFFFPVICFYVYFYLLWFLTNIFKLTFAFCCT